MFSWVTAALQATYLERGTTSGSSALPRTWCSQPIGPLFGPFVNETCRNVPFICAFKKALMGSSMLLLKTPPKVSSSVRSSSSTWDVSYTGLNRQRAGHPHIVNANCNAGIRPGFPNCFFFFGRKRSDKSSKTVWSRFLGHPDTELIWPQVLPWNA